MNPLGSLLIGLVIDKFGRKFALIFSVVPGVLGWLLIYGEYDTFRTLTGRVLTGITCGAVFYPGQVYIGECLVVDDHNLRNRFAMWFGIANSFGMFIVLTLGYFMNYSEIALLMAAVAICIILLFHVFIWESPVWLAHMGRIEEAKRCSKNLGIVHPMLSHYTQCEGVFTVSEEEGGSYVRHFRNVFEKLKRKDVYKPLVIMTTVLTFVMLSGGVAIMTYMFNILSYSKDFNSSGTANGSQNDAEKFGVYSGVLILLANYLVCVLVPYVGVKKLTINSCVFMIFGLLMLYYSYMPATFFSKDTMNSIHVISIWVVIFAFNSGLLNIPVSILGDVFPTDAKGLASIPIFAFCFVCAILVKFFPIWYIDVGADIYLVYAVLTGCAAVIVALFMPETVGKSLKHINDEFFV